MHIVRLGSRFLLTCVAVVAVGCGETASLSSPTAPSAAPASFALAADAIPGSAATASAVNDFTTFDHGRGRGRDGDDKRDDDSDDADDGRPGRGDENRGELSGFVTAVAADSIVVRGVTVKVGPTTVIRHGHRTLTIADIDPGDHVEVRGILNGTALVATEIKVQDMDRDDDEDDDDEDDDKVEGAVSALSGTCPSITFTVGTTKVTTSTATRFKETTCAAVTNGKKVEVKGTTQTDGSIIARSVELD